MVVCVERDPSEFQERAFCKSSVDLWCRSRRKPFVELAIAADSSEERIHALGIASSEPDLRLWLPYVVLPSSGPEALRMLLAFIYRRLDLDIGRTEAIAFAEIGTPEAQSFAQLGWSIERHFPVQIAWNNLQSWTGTTALLADGVQINLEENLDVVARLFLDAFMSEWSWYFRELGCDATNSSQEELLDVALRYVKNASAYLVARRDGKPVGVSSVIIDTSQLHAELHTGVGVSATARGWGLGRALTNATLMWAKQRGMNTAEIRTQERLGDRNRNIEMYEACGGKRERMFALFRLMPCAKA